MKKTYPPKPEFKDTLAYIDKLYKDITDQEKGLKKKQEAEYLARREKYLEAILLLEKYLSANRIGGETNQLRKLVDKYTGRLDERRKELFDSLGEYLTNNDFSGAKDLLLKLKKTYPPKPEYNDALAYIDKLLKDVAEKDKKYNKRLKKTN